MLELKIEKVEDERKNLAHTKINLLKKIFETLADITAEVDVLITKEGMVIQAMDSMQILYADILISNALFSSYRCDRNLVLGLKTAGIVDILRSIRLDNFNYLLITSEDSAKELSVIVESRDCLITRNLTLFNFEKESFNIPELEYSTSIKMPLNFYLFLQKSINDFKGDYLKFTAEKDQLQLQVKGEIMNSRIDIKQSEENENIEINCTEPTDKVIPVKFINIVTKSAGYSDHIVIKFSSFTPVFINCDMGDYGFAKFYIAPKDEEEADKENAENEE